MKAIIYNRTSTKEQNPELQEKDCVEFCKKLGLEIVEIISEKSSAFKKDIKREKWEEVIERAKKEKLDIVVWKYDRAFRNRASFYKFIKVMFEVYKTKVYSVTEPSILSLWEIIGKTNTGNLIVDEFLQGMLKIMWDFLIQQAGEVAEEESKKKSERVKLAIRKEKGAVMSYKGKKWGFHKLPERVNNQIIELYNNGESYNSIKNKVSYSDKNNNKKFVSIGYISKIITFHKLSQENNTQKDKLNDTSQVEQVIKEVGV